MQRTSRTSRRGSFVVAFLLLIGLLAVPVVGAPTAGADPLPAPAIIGASCAPGTGVTVVVDFTTIDNHIELGCALGAQADGFAALHEAGFTTTSESGAGSVCKLDGQPTQGYPYCWTTGGYWSYWSPDVNGVWAYRQTGASTTSLPIDSIEGWAWAPALVNEAPRLAASDTGDFAPGAGVSPAASSALDWLESQLAANDWSMPGTGANKWGLTLDAVLALAAGGRGGGVAAQQATAALEANVDEYVAAPPQYPGFRFAGALAKELLVAGVQGLAVEDFGGWDLDAELRDLMLVSGDWSGRFVDAIPNVEAPGSSNGFDQALAVLGLARTDDGVPEEAVRFLLAQQCPGGGFRLSLATTPNCVSATNADTDATAMAVQALLTVPRTPPVKAALGVASRWLLSQQDPVTGSFSGSGWTAIPNSNSTGLIAQALSQIGQASAATKAETWIATLQLTPANAGSTPAAGDIGGIAYTPVGLTTALAGGITANAGDQWRRATSQAVLGLGLPAFGSINNATPVVPVTPVNPQQFSDVSSAQTFFNDITWLVAGGITTGFEDGTFRPSVNVSRQANAAFLYRLAGSPPFVAPTTPSFSDVPKSNVFYTQIEWMKAEGLSTGYGDGTFRPDNPVQRQAFAAFLYRLAGSPTVPVDAPTFTDVPPTHPFFTEISWLAAVGVTTGYANGTFRPDTSISRQATAAFLHRFALLP